MREMGHEEMKDLVAAYVLGSIPQDEIPLVRAHILSCDECMAEADSYSGAVDDLAMAVDPVSPPAGFTDRVMAAATAHPDLAARPEVVSLEDRKRRPTASRGLAAAAVFVAILVSSISIYGALSANDDLDRTQAVLTALLHNSEGSIPLQGSGGAVAQVVPTFEGAYLVATGLQEAPANHVYQLWLMRDGEPVSAGLFDGADDISIVNTSADLESYEAAAITIEPAGGSAKPTTEPILSSV